MGLLLGNNILTTLAGSIAAGDTSITVVDGSKFPALTKGGDFTWATLSDAGETVWEHVKVTSRQGNLLKVLRGQDSTAAASWAAGTKVSSRANAKALLSIGNQKPTGFLGLFRSWPNAAKFASAATDVAVAAHPWMRGSRFWTSGVENICPTSSPAGTSWNTDIAAVSSYRPPLDLWMTRMTAQPSLASYDLTVAAALTKLDEVIAGIVALSTASGTRDFLFDPESYASSDISYLFNYNVGATGVGHSGTATRAATCAVMEEFGRQFGLGLWSRVPDARLHLFFGSSVLVPWTGSPSGTQIPASALDLGTSGWAVDPYYNMLPYFCKGLLDACPASGRIVDYCEGSYGFAGLLTLSRHLHASKNWVSLFFPTETGLITKSVAQWVPVPILYPDQYFIQRGAWYAGANYITVLADQQAKFTRDAVYALELTPPGYMPAVYTDEGNPWGQGAAVLAMDSGWQTCLNNALAIFSGSMVPPYNIKTLASALKAYFVSRADFVKECL